MNRMEALKKEKLFHTYEMVDWLQTTAGTPEEMGETLLGAWVGVLRYDALLHAEHDKKFLSLLQHGEARLRLNKELAPAGWNAWEKGAWRNEDLWTQITSETGLSHEEVRDLLSWVGKKLSKLVGEKAFEPIGWIDQGEEGTLLVRCWSDFLHPMSDDPKDLILGASVPPL